MFFCWKSKKTLVILGFLLEIQTNPSKSWFFAGNPKKNLVFLGCLLEIQEFPSKTRKTKNTSRKPRIQDFVVDQTSTWKSWILGFLVFSRFSWFYVKNAKNPRNSEGFTAKPSKTQGILSFWLRDLSEKHISFYTCFLNAFLFFLKKEKTWVFAHGLLKPSKNTVFS